MNILDDLDREFAASPFLRREVLPRAIFNNRETETAFYAAFFSTVTHWATDLDAVTDIAHRGRPSLRRLCRGFTHEWQAPANEADQDVLRVGTFKSSESESSCSPAPLTTSMPMLSHPMTPSQVS
jgi:hypothetical protein